MTDDDNPGSVRLGRRARPLGVRGMRRSMTGCASKALRGSARRLLERGRRRAIRLGAPNIRHSAQRLQAGRGGSTQQGQESIGTLNSAKPTPPLRHRGRSLGAATAPIAFRGRMTPHPRRMQTRLPHRPDALLLQDPIGLGARRRRGRLAGRAPQMGGGALIHAQAFMVYWACR